MNEKHWTDIQSDGNKAEYLVQAHKNSGTKNRCAEGTCILTNKELCGVMDLGSKLQKILKTTNGSRIADFEDTEDFVRLCVEKNL